MKYSLLPSLFTIFTLCGSTLARADTSLQQQFQTLEESFNGKIGLYAIDTNSHQIIAHRASERFPLQSTFKLIGVSALLKECHYNKKLLQENMHYTKEDLISWHPITGKYVKDGMTLEALSEAAISYSDNSAINLIMKKLGGPKIVSDFAHSIGNKSFNLLHYEGALNSNPENSSDTSTPKDMAISVEKLTLGNVLTKSDQTKLVTWMKNNTVAYKRIRTGVLIGWTVADKTGSGDYGIANDIGILWSPLCKPIVLAIYTIQNKQDAKRREDIVASATKIVMDEFAKQDGCFAALNN